MNVSPRDLETENVALREELERARSKLRHLEESKRSFVALAAHELRTPLTILFGYAKLMGDGSESEAREYAGIIATYSWQLKNTVDSIITLQQIDTGELGLDLRALPLGEIIDNAVASRQREISEKALEIQSDLESGLYVQADRERLLLVFGQLLANSIKYTPHAGTIAIEARAKQASIQVSLRDNGIGIPAEELPHVFERFYQSSNPLTRQHSGIGLGLAVAKEIVELHGGRIGVESRPSQGSTFYFSLPRAAVQTISNSQRRVIM
jgi:signal transduction histidine kinase